MRKSLFTAFAFILLGTLFGFPQTKPKSVSTISDSDPFKIEQGSTFSASKTRQNSNPAQDVLKIEEIGKDQITEDFSQALDIIRKNHVNGKKLDFNQLAKSSINSMLRTLDPHSYYFDAVEYQDLLSDQRSEYYGIGATIANYQKNGDYETFIIATFPDSPAFRAGLQFGDKIVAVNGENVLGKSSGYVRDKVRGRKGTIARLTVERSDSLKFETVEIRRNRVPQPSIPDAYILRPGVGYVDLSEGFNYTTIDELNAALSDLREQGMTSLILDLRDNPGGILEQAVRVAEKFLPAGQTIVSQRGRFRIDNRTWKSSNKIPETIPLVVLVNENSASASEIVAGAFQDYDRALIIGETTFGKGLVQSVINLPYSSGLTLTTAKYYTPSGRLIQRDYSKVNLYDYYNHKGSVNEKDKIPSKTLTGRIVYGGDGIMPDELVKNPTHNQTQNLLMDPIFFFSREIVGGKIKGFEHLKIKSQIQFSQRIRPGSLEISEELFTAFENFVLKNSKITRAQLKAERSFIKTRLRYNLATSKYGTVAANQVLIEEDLQVVKAVEVLPKAQQLALSARRSLQKQNK